MFKKPEIKRLNNCISNNSNWCRDAIAFEVKNGLGKLGACRKRLQFAAPS